MSKEGPSKNLPCPFCGGLGMIRLTQQWGTGKKKIVYSVICTVCIAEGSQHKTAEEALAAWNTRSL